ncbi:MAG: DUF4430 domain-containing protein [Clostridia bacterium]|nr:DUF4430 domain-containing protein [Clostridia bacterium]
MKKTLKTALSLTLTLLFIFALVACHKEEATDLWKDATYTEDTVLGEGAKTVTVEVMVEEKTVTFTIKTDKETVGDALIEHKLLDGEQDDYGLYVKKVNGITADYDVDQSYWAFYIDGEYAMTGVDGTPLEEALTYRLAYTK